MEYLDIKLEGSDGQTHALDDFKDQKVVLYFYPKDNTSACTLQAKDFTLNKDKFAKKGYQIIGVSRDSLSSHANFIQKQNLDILLLSDPDEKLIKAFDVLKEKKMYGKTFIGIERSTFILDKNGVIVESHRKVKVKDHVIGLLEKLS